VQIIIYLTFSLPGVSQRGLRAALDSCMSLVLLAQIPLTIFGFKKKIFYLISLHSYKQFFPLCFKSSIFITVFMFLDSMATFKRHLQKE
jgi:hypothetical protein